MKEFTGLVPDDLLKKCRVGVMVRLEAEILKVKIVEERHEEEHIYAEDMNELLEEIGKEAGDCDEDDIEILKQCCEWYTVNYSQYNVTLVLRDGIIEYQTCKKPGQNPGNIEVWFGSKSYTGSYSCEVINEGERIETATKIISPEAREIKYRAYLEESARNKIPFFRLRLDFQHENTTFEYRGHWLYRNRLEMLQIELLKRIMGIEGLPVVEQDGIEKFDRDVLHVFSGVKMDEKTPIDEYLFRVFGYQRREWQELQKVQKNILKQISLAIERVEFYKIFIANANIRKMTQEPLPEHLDDLKEYRRREEELQDLIKKLSAVCQEK